MAPRAESPHNFQGEQCIVPARNGNPMRGQARKRARELVLAILCLVLHGLCFWLVVVPRLSQMYKAAKKKTKLKVKIKAEGSSALSVLKKLGMKEPDGNQRT